MYRSILVPLDGSAFGEQALPLALNIARLAKASLRLVHVHVPLPPVYAGGISAFETNMDVEARERGREYLQKVSRSLGSEVSVTTDVVEGPIADSLIEQAAATGCDLLVMTTHGRGGLSRFWLGSVADQLVRSSPVPLLLRRPREKTGQDGDEKLPQKILIPLDGSPLAEKIIEPAQALGSLVDATYTLLRVIDPLQTSGYDMAGFAISGLDPTLQEQLRADAQQYLERVAQRLAGGTGRVATRVLVHSQPASAILDAAREDGMDLIALATHGRGGVRRLLLGSVADKVLRENQGAMLVLRPQDT
jgi:nucleotide-binding universal stress UspA family protein